MGTWTDWLVTAAGAGILLLAVRDVFHTLWHPSGRGSLSHGVMLAVWRIGRRRRGRDGSGALTGPLGLLSVIVTWLALLVLGGALVYGPHLPEGFVLGTGLDADERGGALDAAYLSLVTVATLGFGDIVPAADWLRIAVPLQALLGFGLLTAAVTWVLQVYPALIRRRALAVRLAVLRRGDPRALLADPDSSLAAPLLESLAAGLGQARVDVTQYTETYFFRDGDAEAALPAMAGVAADLADAGRSAPRADVRAAAGILAVAVADFARVVDEEFLHTGRDTAHLLEAYAADHHYARAGLDQEHDGRP
jgi:Ion channel